MYRAARVLLRSEEVAARRLLDLHDPRYQLIRKTLPIRDRFFNDLKALRQYVKASD